MGHPPWPLAGKSDIQGGIGNSRYQAYSLSHDIITVNSRLLPQTITPDPVGERESMLFLRAEGALQQFRVRRLSCVLGPCHRASSKAQPSND